MLFNLEFTELPGHLDVDTIILTSENPTKTRHFVSEPFSTVPSTPICGQDSPNSNDSIYGTPRGISSSPGQGYPKMAGTCEICFERQATGVAVPCGHKNMCSFCKGNLHQDTAQCPSLS
jgi:hypothetical protein